MPHCSDDQKAHKYLHLIENGGPQNQGKRPRLIISPAIFIEISDWYWKIPSAHALDLLPRLKSRVSNSQLLLPCQLPKDEMPFMLQQLQELI